MWGQLHKVNRNRSGPLNSFNTINEFMIFKEELQSTLCCQDNSSLCHETSRDTWKTFGTGTTLPCPPRSPTSVSLPLPPEVSPSWLPNPCSDVDSTTSAPALTSQNYLRLLSKASDTNGYVTPRPASAVTCGCQQYQNMVTNHVCPSTSSAAWSWIIKLTFIFGEFLFYKPHSKSREQFLYL